MANARRPLALHRRVAPVPFVTLSLVVSVMSAAFAGLATDLTLTSRYGEPAPGAAVLSDPAARLFVHALQGLALVAALVVLAAGARFVVVSRRLPNPLTLYLLPFLGSWMLSVVLGSGSGTSFVPLLCWIIVLSLALLPSEQVLAGAMVGSARGLVYVMLAASMVAALVVPFWAYSPYSAWPGGWRPGHDRLQGTMPQPNSLSWIATFGLAMEVALWQRRRWLLRTASVLACAVVLVLSGSRSSLAALLVSLVVVGGLKLRAARRLLGRRRPALTYALLVIISGGVIVLAVTHAHRLTSLNGRTATWNQAWAFVRQSPIFGTGPSAYARAAGVPYAHNQLLQSLSDQGGLGGLALIWLSAGLLIVTGRHLRASRLLVPLLTVTWFCLYLTEGLLRFVTLSFLVPVLIVLLPSLASRVDPLPSYAAESGDPRERREWQVAGRAP